MISGDISVNGNGRVLTIAIMKNGTTASPLGVAAMRIQAADQPYQFSTVIYVQDMVANDYLELYVTSTNSGDNVTFKDVHWFIDTQ